MAESDKTITEILDLLGNNLGGNNEAVKDDTNTANQGERSSENKENQVAQDTKEVKVETPKVETPANPQIPQIPATPPTIDDELLQGINPKVAEVLKPFTSKVKDYIKQREQEIRSVAYADAVRGYIHSKIMDAIIAEVPEVANTPQVIYDTSNELAAQGKYAPPDKLLDNVKILIDAVKNKVKPVQPPVAPSPKNSPISTNTGTSPNFASKPAPTPKTKYNVDDDILSEFGL